MGLTDLLDGLIKLDWMDLIALLKLNGAIRNFWIRLDCTVLAATTNEC